jgi:hypothetical protein
MINLILRCSDNKDHYLLLLYLNYRYEYLYYCLLSLIRFMTRNNVEIIMHDNSPDPML